MQESFLTAEGVLQKKDGVVSLRVDSAAPLGNVALEMSSHDFH